MKINNLKSKFENITIINKFKKNNIIRFRKNKSKNINNKNVDTEIISFDNFKPDKMDLRPVSDEVKDIIIMMKTQILTNTEKTEDNIVKINTVKDEKEVEYDNFIKFITLNVLEDNKLPENNFIIENLKINPKSRFRTLREKGIENGDLIVKNQKTYLNL